MNYLKIKDLKNRNTLTDEYITGMWYDIFCKESYLPNKGRKLLNRLFSVVKSAPTEFNGDDEIDFKNCCTGVGKTYDVVRVWRGKDFRFAFVPNEADGGCSYLRGKEGSINMFSNWRELRKGLYEESKGVKNG